MKKTWKTILNNLGFKGIPKRAGLVLLASVSHAEEELAKVCMIPQIEVEQYLKRYKKAGIIDENGPKYRWIRGFRQPNDTDIIRLVMDIFVGAGEITIKRTGRKRRYCEVKRKAS